MQIAIFTGLHCDACVKLLSKKLSRIPGVLAVNSLDTLGTFNLEVEHPISESQVKAAIEGTDYQLLSLE